MRRILGGLRFSDTPRQSYNGQPLFHIQMWGMQTPRSESRKGDSFCYLSLIRITPNKSGIVHSFWLNSNIWLRKGYLFSKLWRPAGVLSKYIISLFFEVIFGKQYGGKADDLFGDNRSLKMRPDRIRLPFASIILKDIFDVSGASRHYDILA